MPEPRLFRRDPRLETTGIVLMLHGGARTGTRPVGVRSASFWRTTAMRDALEPRVLDKGLSVWLMRFGVRGWNADHGSDPSPVPDARWALDRAAEEHPGVPVVLLGHSMGARTAVHVADHPSVVGVVALAQWLEPSDPVRRLAEQLPTVWRRPDLLLCGGDSTFSPDKRSKEARCTSRPGPSRSSCSVHSS